MVGLAILVFTLLVIGLALPNFTKSAFAGTLYAPALPAPEIELTDHNGRPFELSSLRGKPVLIYFGYTNCPDECPLTMARLSQAFDLLNEDGRNVQVLLVSTDPARDTPEALKTYLARFHPSFLGLTGSHQELEKVYRDYGVIVMDDGGTHSNRVYVIDRFGYLRLTFMYELTPSDIASDLKILLRE